MSIIWLSQLLIPEESSKKLYNELKKSVEIYIIPKLLKEGFVQNPHPFYKSQNYREKSYNPHGVFRRKSQQREDIIEIVYDDRKFPKFHLEFGMAPNNGVLIRGIHFTQKKMSVAECPFHFSLSSSVYSFQPFIVMWPLMDKNDIPNIVKKANLLVMQIFDWFDNNYIGPNIFGGREADVVEVYGDSPS